MRISDWSSDVCSSDLFDVIDRRVDGGTQHRIHPNIQIVAACGLRNFHDWDIASLDLRKLFPELSDPVGGEHLVQPRDRDLGNLGELLDLLEHLASLHHIRGYKPLAERIAQARTQTELRFQRRDRKSTRLNSSH